MKASCREQFHDLGSKKVPKRRFLPKSDTLATKLGGSRGPKSGSYWGIIAGGTLYHHIGQIYFADSPDTAPDWREHFFKAKEPNPRFGSFAEPLKPQISAPRINFPVTPPLLI